MKSNESSEDYLETILILSKRLPFVRSIDIANELNFKKSSISIAMKNLRKNGYILVSDSGYITLTTSGLQIADMVFERHTILTSYLISLGVNAQTAAADACRMEHILSTESFEAIKNHIDN